MSRCCRPLRARNASSPALQGSAASTLGAPAVCTGGLVCDHGWLRLLGSGARGLWGLADANGLAGPQQPPPSSLTVAYDVLGGRFAINGGALVRAVGEVCAAFVDIDLFTEQEGRSELELRRGSDGSVTATFLDAHVL